MLWYFFREVLNREPGDFSCARTTPEMLSVKGSIPKSVLQDTWSGQLFSPSFPLNNPIIVSVQLLFFDSGSNFTAIFGSGPLQAFFRR